MHIEKNIVRNKIADIILAKKDSHLDKYNRDGFCFIIEWMCVFVYSFW